MPNTSLSRGWKAFRFHVVVALVAALVLVAGGLAIAQDRTITSAVAIRQDYLAAGSYTGQPGLAIGPPVLRRLLPARRRAR